MMRPKPTTSNRDYAAAIATAVFGEPTDVDDIYVPGVLDALTTLSEGDEKVIDMRYRQGTTLQAIADCMGVGTEKIKQIRDRALRKLRHPSRSRYMRISSILRQLEMMEQYFSECRAELGTQRKKTEQYRKMLQSSGNCSSCTFMADSSPLIDELELPLRAYNCLKRAGVDSAHKIATLNAPELLHIRNLGKTSARHIIDAMKGAGYTEWAQKMLDEMG